ncbi:MAG: hypothetical protein M3Q07_08470 [Pseudobdellovibrionaceae bacterium]|nr:hypothetical protein [Pseudobdellovibrionaceae bacterium]
MKVWWMGLFIFTLVSCGDADKNTADPPARPTGPEQEAQAPFALSTNQTFAVKIVWNHPPRSQSLDNSAEVYFVDKNSQNLVDTRLLRFHLYMASMGHPSIKEEDMVFNQVAPGHWTVSRIFFSMGGSAGSWVVDLEAEVEGQPDKVRVSIPHEVE